MVSSQELLEVKDTLYSEPVSNTKKVVDVLKGKNPMLSGQRVLAIVPEAILFR